MLGIGPNFLLFLASTTLNAIALHCIRFGVSWLVMRETGSAAAFAVIFSASSLVEVYSKPILSPMADYFDRLKVYLVCVGIGSAVVTILLAVLLLPFSIAAVTILLMALSLVAGRRDPASAGLAPALVNADRLTKARSLRSTVGSVLSLGAPMLSALLLYVGGTPAALSAAAILCAIGLATTFGVKLLRADVVAAPKRWGELLEDLASAHCRRCARGDPDPL